MGSDLVIGKRPELLYNVNQDDAVIGSIDRNEAHSEETLHRSGIVFILRRDRSILIQHRSQAKVLFPDCYDASAAFHVMYGETYAAAADRELKEETGISTKLTYVGKFKHYDPPENQFVAVFIGISNEPVTIDRNEASDATFCSKLEVERIVASGKITPWLRDGWRIVRDLI